MPSIVQNCFNVLLFVHEFLLCPELWNRSSGTFSRVFHAGPSPLSSPYCRALHDVNVLHRTNKGPIPLRWWISILCTRVWALVRTLADFTLGHCSLILTWLRERVVILHSWLLPITGKTDTDYTLIWKTLQSFFYISVHKFGRLLN